MEWISVKECLPDYMVEVIVKNDKDKEFVAYRTYPHTTWTIKSGGSSDFITHWRPIFKYDTKLGYKE